MSYLIVPTLRPLASVIVNTLGPTPRVPDGSPGTEYSTPVAVLVQIKA
jgi:hypothetical protein